MTEKRTKTKGIPDHVDKHVGSQLRARRIFLGMSQEKLADSAGITFQQVQKYERGANRVSAGRLFGFSKTLDVPVNFFYDGILSKTSETPAAIGMSDNAQEGFGVEKPTGFCPVNRADLDAVLDAFSSITNEAKRQQFLNFVLKESKKYV